MEYKKSILGYMQGTYTNLRKDKGALHTRGVGARPCGLGLCLGGSGRAAWARLTGFAFPR